MDRKTYLLLENYMISCMGDSAHDKEHIYRVLYNALEIAKSEIGVEYDVLIGACLLHDIGRKEQFENPKLCHAMVGSEKAYRHKALKLKYYLMLINWIWQVQLELHVH